MARGKKNVVSELLVRIPDCVCERLNDSLFRVVPVAFKSVGY